MGHLNSPRGQSNKSWWCRANSSERDFFVNHKNIFSRLPLLSLFQRACFWKEWMCEYLPLLWLQWEGTSPGSSWVKRGTGLKVIVPQLNWVGKTAAHPDRQTDSQTAGWILLALTALSPLDAVPVLRVRLSVGSAGMPDRHNMDRAQLFLKARCAD